MPNIDDDNEIAFFTFHLFSIIFMCHTPHHKNGKYVLLHHIFRFAKIRALQINLFCAP